MDQKPEPSRAARTREAVRGLCLEDAEELAAGRAGQAARTPRSSPAGAPPRALPGEMQPPGNTTAWTPARFSVRPRGRPWRLLPWTPWPQEGFTTLVGGGTGVAVFFN